MTRKRIVIVVLAFLGLLILAPILGVLAIRSGPTADVPTEDPIVTWNREHADLENNAAPLYQEAIEALTRDDLRKILEQSKWRRGDPLPPEAAEYVQANARTLELMEAATALPNCWFELDRDVNGSVVIPHLSEMRNLAKLLRWKALQSAGQHDAAQFAQTVTNLDQLARHVTAAPSIIARLVGIACAALAQDLVREPLTWAALDAPARAAYFDRVAPCFEPLRAMEDALRSDLELFAWEASQTFGSNITGRLLAPRGRVYAELERVYAPHFELSHRPLWEQFDARSPLRQQLAAMENQTSTPWNMARLAAGMLPPSLVRSIEINARLRTEQLGNRLVFRLTEHRDTTGSLPDTLAAFPDDLKLDPFTGQPFLYRRTDDGFTLYSAGYDRDDDGGQHHNRFGERGEDLRTGAEIPDDGDYVFWPIPAPDKPDATGSE